GSVARTATREPGGVSGCAGGVCCFTAAGGLEAFLGSSLLSGSSSLGQLSREASTCCSAECRRHSTDQHRHRRRLECPWGRLVGGCSLCCSLCSLWQFGSGNNLRLYYAIG